eukprot:scaffold97414_cov60-Attheya_sp.AAC.1
MDRREDPKQSFPRIGPGYSDALSVASDLTWRRQRLFGPLEKQLLQEQYQEFDTMRHSATLRPAAGIFRRRQQ